jgi:large subunit ribosomal protein L7Ae
MASKGKRVAPAPKSTSKIVKKVAKDWKSEHSHLFPKTPRSYRIGNALPHKRDLTRFVRWPTYVRLQRQKAILKQRLKVPPSINQFAHALEKNQAANLFRLLATYRPETKEEKTKRLKSAAKQEVKQGEAKQGPKPIFVKAGLNHVTELVESKRAKLVVIAHDVDPIELVVWLPALCRKMNVPYCIVKGKARLGHVVHKKTATTLAITDVRKEDQAKLDQLVQNFRLSYNDNVSDRKKWGGGILGPKAQAVIRKREAAVKAAAAAKLK